jgi:hypothetical protein
LDAENRSKYVQWSDINDQETRKQIREDYVEMRSETRVSIEPAVVQFMFGTIVTSNEERK